MRLFAQKGNRNEKLSDKEARFGGQKRGFGGLVRWQEQRLERDQREETTD